MPPRNHRDWTKEPKVEHISSLIYFDHSLYEQELENIFSKVWIPMCHSSEMPHLGDFRKTQIALQNVVAVRFENGVVKTFLTDKVQAPAGNDLSLTYHSGNWTELPCEVKHGGMVGGTHFKPLAVLLFGLERRWAMMADESRMMAMNALLSFRRRSGEDINSIWARYQVVRQCPTTSSCRGKFDNKC